MYYLLVLEAIAKHQKTSLLGRSFKNNNFERTSFDYTEDYFKFMRRKNSIMKKYEKEFEQESNSFIWKQYMRESIDESVLEIPDGFSRFIYRAVKA